MANIKISGATYPLALNQSTSPNGTEIVPADSVVSSIRNTYGFTFSSLLGPIAVNYTTKTATFSGATSGSAVTITAGNYLSGVGLTVNGGYTGSGNIGLVTMSDTNNTNGCNLRIVGNGGTTASKTIRVFSGSLQITNDAYSAVLFQLSDAGAATINATSGSALTLNGSGASAALVSNGGASFAASFSNTSGDTVISANNSGHASFLSNLTNGGYGLYVNAVSGSYGLWVQGPSATQLNFLSGNQLGQNNWLLYQPPSNTDLRFNDGAGHDVLILKDSGGIIVTAGSISSSVTPSSAWQLDCTGAGSSTNEVTIANNGTYTIPYGSGVLYMYETSPNPNMAYAFLVFANISLTNVSGTGFTGVVGTSGKINLGWNGSNYYIQNLTGAGVTIAISTLRLRTST